MNWGKGIFLGLALFMGFIITLAVFIFCAPNDDYDHQYYEKGLSFNHDYDREVQVYKDHALPIIKQNGQNVRLTFSQPVTNGSVTFSRPSNSKMDKTFVIKTSPTNEMIIPVSQVYSGKWQVVFAWESNHKKYLYQHGIYLK
jgi:hypothetical protein